jgi:hypothetical protein
MPEIETKLRLRGLILSARELKEMTGWPDALVEDYLNLLDNFITIGGLLDIEIDQKIEEVPTAFANGSIPFANNGFLAQDNGHLFWDLTNSLLKISGQIQSQGRLKGGTIVTNIMSPYTILENDETVTADTDTGAIILQLPPGVDQAAYRIVNGGTSGNDITLIPDGTDPLFGVNASEFLIDLEHLDIQYSVKGWN